MRPWFVFILWLCWVNAVPGAANVRAADLLPTVKVVRQYALTSANDFPLRDPEAWQLLASNDGGKSWVTLDQRTNEVFSERHQRRVFRISNRTAFNIYRLQIDRVRDPTEANAVQLAEIEPMGETENDLDPVPIFADTVTAQGENPPFELIRFVFDGQLETKWLDHATQFATNRSSWIQWQYTAPPNAVVKNIRDLLSLRSRANDAYPVQINGRIIGKLRGTNAFCFMDDTGYLPISAVGDNLGIFPGQQVLLTGKSTVIAGRPNVEHASLVKNGPDVPAQPQSVTLEDSMSPGNEWQWVEIEGQIGFHSQTSDQTAIELTDGTRQIQVHLLSPQAPDFRKLNPTRIRVDGLREGVLNSKGKLVTGILWVAGAESLKPVTPTSGRDAIAGVIPSAKSLTSTQLLTTISQIREMSRNNLITGPPVKLRGVVIETQGLFMQEDTDGIELWEEDGQPQLTRNFGDYIEVEGRARWVTKSGPKVEVDQVKILGKGELPPPAHLSWSQMTSGKPIDRWIELDGVVRSTDGSHLLLMCDGGQIMATIRSALADEVKKLVDATVRIRGVGVVATDDRGQVQGVQLIVPSLDYVEVTSPAIDTFALASRPIGTLLQIKPLQDLAHRVKIQGTVILQQGSKVFLQDNSGSAMAVARQDVVLSEPSDRVMHWLFWRMPATSQTAADMPTLAVGDQVQVVGFLESGGESPVLTEAIFHNAGPGKLIKPTPTSLDEILTGKPDSSLVSLDCLVLDHEVLGTDSVLQLEVGQKVFQAVLAGNKRAFNDLMSGSRVRITGVCQVERAPYAELGETVSAFKFLLRTPNDLFVLERPPWWDFKHTMIVAGALVFILVLAGGWIRTLHRQVEERTKRLKKEIEEHKVTEKQLAEETRRVQAEIEEHMRTEMQLAEKTGLLEKEIEERKRIQAEVERVHRELVMTSRLAGMAEVATGVLHNVGNVLNSVNVLASLIINHVHKSKVSSVSKLASLLDEHRHDLGRFMTEDAQGQQIPGYVEHLAGHLADEQTRLLEKVKSITDNIQHIKEIVATQQSYARIGGALEEISLREIVEDSLRMHSEALARHGIDILRECEDVPPMTVDRHKILQILFNLLANATYACENSGQPTKQIIVRIRKMEQSVQIAVTDNGIGIPPENLPKIFSQGFTTRAGGHGFGLHSSILAAQEMEGSLSAHSRGPGQGATFVLEIPVTARPIVITAKLNGQSTSSNLNN
jgi:signal transduction histidine kinase